MKMKFLEFFSKHKQSLLCFLMVGLLLCVFVTMLIMPKSMKASAAAIYGGFDTYIDEIDDVSYLRVICEPNMQGEGDSGNPNAFFNLSYYIIEVKFNGSVLHSKNVSPTAFVLENNYSIALSDIYEFVKVGIYTLEITAYFVGDGNANLYSTETYIVSAGTVPLPPDPVREGHTFKGWYFDEACTIPYDNSPIFADTSLYAGWTINTYEVTFDSVGGSAVEKQATNWNTAIINLATPTRTGYTFKGWLLNGVLYNNQPIMANTTLTASWEELVYTVTFYVGGEVHQTLNIKYGYAFNRIMQEQLLMNYNIKSLSTTSGELDTATDILTVSGDMKVELTPKNTVQKVKASWLKYLLGAVSGCAIIALLCAVPTIFKKKRKYKA